MTGLRTAAPAERLLIAYLAARLPTVTDDRGRAFLMTVASRVPNPRPAECVVLYRTGGTMRDLVTDQPQITVEVRAKTEERCALVIGVVRALLWELEGQVLEGHQVYTVDEFAGPANLPDPLGGVRYSMTLSLAIRADALAAAYSVEGGAA